MGRCAHFKGLFVPMKACVGVGEPAEVLALPVPFTDVGRSCAHDTEAMGNRDSPTSHQRLDQKPHFLL